MSRYLLDTTALIDFSKGRSRTPSAPLASVGGRRLYQGRGKEWAEQELGLSVQVVHRTPKPTPEKTAKIWAKEWAKEGREIDWQKLLARRGFEVLPRRWVVERTFSWLSQNRRMSKDYERLCATSEAFIYAAMTRLMVVRRLASA
jgi:putative transposase